MNHTDRWISFGLLITILTACQLTPTPTPSPAATPTRTPVPSLTISPTSTASATPTDLPEPLTVGISLRDAEREVLSWFDPTREPRIEWSRYVRRAVLTEVLRDLGSEALWDTWGTVIMPRTFDTLGDPLILVVGSTRGIDPLSGPPIDGRPRLQPQAQPEAISPDRLSVLAVFDAYTGERLAAQTTGRVWIDQPNVFLDTLHGMRPAQVIARTEARRTLTPWPTSDSDPALHGATSTPAPPSPTPTAVPAEARLTLANLPAALRPTFDAYPLAPGSARTWRFTYASNDVRWVAAFITETIESAWREGDMAVVSSRIDVRLLTPPKNQDDDWHVDFPTTALRYVTPRFIVASGDDVLDAENFRIGALTVGSPFDEGGIARELFVHLLPNPGDLGSTYVGEGPATITSRAGSFDDCWEVQRIGGAQWGSVRWFCPGVGNVQYGFGGCGGSSCSTAVADLIRWRRATLPAH